MRERLIDSIIILVLITAGYITHSVVNNVSNTGPETAGVEISVTGQTEYGLGDLADFAATTNNKKVQLVSDWKILKNNQEVVFKTLNDNNIIFPVGVEKTNIQVLFHGSYIDPSTKKIKTSGFVVKNVTVGGQVPTPPEPPKPEPDNPIIPDGKYKISQTVYTTAVALVQSSKLPESAGALSRSYQTVADNITKKQYTSLKDAYADLKTKNAEAIKSVKGNIDDWQAWDDAIRKIVTNLHNTKKLNLIDHADILSEISIGLSYIK
jgi:hypothetical protein